MIGLVEVCNIMPSEADTETMEPGKMYSKIAYLSLLVDADGRLPVALILIERFN